VSVERTVQIDAEIASVGQFDRTETWRGKVGVTLLDDGRVRLGNPTQSGLESITVSLDDLREAVS